MKFYTYRAMLKDAAAVKESYLSFLQKGGTPFYAPAPGLGWSIEPSAYHATEDCHSNQDGFRRTIGDEEKVAGPPVISVWGDSLVQGGEVADSDSWLWLLQERLLNSYKIVNGGVSGYGTDQAYLRFQKRFQRVSSQMAFLAYATTDLLRNVNVQRSFLHHGAGFIFLKPRFVLENDKPRLIAPPYYDYMDAPDVLDDPSTREHLQRYDRFFPKLLQQFLEKATRRLNLNHAIGSLKSIRDEALQVTAAILSMFISFCKKKEITGVVLFFQCIRDTFQAGRTSISLLSMFIPRAVDISTSETPS